jgi:hypothetical protein
MSEKGEAARVIYITLTDPECIQTHKSGFGRSGGIRRPGFSLR